MDKTPERIMQFPHDYPEERIITWKDDDTGKFVGMCKYIRADLVPQWQPIETAPKDGTEILTIRSNGYIRNAKWYDNPFGRKDTVIDDADGKWWSVTHWMPLPSPPA